MPFSAGETRPSELELAPVSYLLRVEGINSSRCATCLGLKFSLSPRELDASLGKFRVKILHEKMSLSFLLALFLDLTNNHQNPEQPLGLAL